MGQDCRNKKAPIRSGLLLFYLLIQAAIIKLWSVPLIVIGLRNAGAETQGL
jgi:hypothetical protein